MSNEGAGPLLTSHDSQTAYNMAYVAENSRKFFSPACIDEMLQEFVPHIIGSNLDVGSTMVFSLHF
jgi:hypothetical protein